MDRPMDNEARSHPDVHLPLLPALALESMAAVDRLCAWIGG